MNGSTRAARTPTGYLALLVRTTGRDSTGAATPIDNHANESRNTDPEWNRRAMLQPCTFIGRTAFTHDDEGDVGVCHNEALTYVEQTWEADSGAPAMSPRLQATGARRRCRPRAATDDNVCYVYQHS